MPEPAEAELRTHRTRLYQTNDCESVTMRNLDQLKNLVVMAASDGSLTEQEISLLVDRCAELGLTEDDLEAAIDYAMSNEASIRLPEDRHDQLEVIRDLVRMMAADGVLSEVEKRLFALTAAKLGIQRDELNKIIDDLLANFKKP